MLLNKVNVQNSRGSILELPLEDSSGGFVVKEIEGLEPVKANLVSSSFANQDGEQFQSSRREARNIKIKLGYEPNWATGSIKDLRDKLYQYFMPKASPLLTFNLFDKLAEDVFSQYLDLNIIGMVETFDAPLFTSDPEANISLMCFDPDFYDPNVVTVNGDTVSDATVQTISYAGSIETGFIFNLRPDRAITEFTIYLTSPDGKLITSYFAYNLLANDVLQVSSVVGQKSVNLVRAGVQSSVLYSMSPQSGWPLLYPGDNQLRVYAEGASIPFDIQYLNKYGGL